MLRLVCLSALTLISVTIALAQPNPDTLWTRTYGGNNNDYANSIVPTTDGGYVVAGSTYYPGSGYPDFYVVKTDSQGDTLWTRTFGGSGEDAASSVQQTADGGYAVAGYSDAGAYLVKTDAQGDTLWTRTYGGGYASSIQQTTDGGYVMAGTNCVGGCNFFVVKTDAQGDSLWTRTYVRTGQDQAYSIQQTTDGGYVVAGFDDPLNTGYYDFYVIKTDAQGDMLWNHSYGGNSIEWARSIQQTTDGGYVVAGYTDSFGGSRNVYVVKTDEQGNALWTRTYGGNGVDEAFSIQQTTDGGFVIAGYTTPSLQSYSDYYVVKTDAQGDTLWTRTYGEGNSDGAYAIQQTTDGGYVVAGYTSSFGAGLQDLYVVKTGPDGFVPQPNISVTPSELNFSSVLIGDSLSLPIVFRSTGDTLLVVSSVTLLQDFHSDFSLPQTLAPGESLMVNVTFAPTEAGDYVDTLFIHSNAPDSIVFVRLFGTGLANSASDFPLSPLSFSLSAYPNPFNPTTEIRYDLPHAAHVSLRVVDIMGREVAMLVNEPQAAGSYSATYDGTSLPSGIYLCRFETGNYSTVQKLTLIK